MKLSTKGRFAITAMMDIAIHERSGPVTLIGISERQGISMSYLEQMFAKLRKGGLVEGIRGPGGGYRLARRPDKISVANIIDALGDTMNLNRLKQHPSDSEEELPLTERLWQEFDQKLHDFLDGITLDEFANHPEVQKVMGKPDLRQHRARHHFIFDNAA
ncbi:Iron-sulfur cluster regulator IscR [Thioalkalivibrio nitratireducens DSM 14787]|uniref:Iron-sulfur cluster regulator IscR n=1 Tax=Thioalkalivibrio nitratireducens (strain DSM 14787 / UNIQEM 213 / ALEN2) TaxID=1255043 RepID=L0DR53_THIND|nr:Rrf2 family transcriptional regulator [Thioalkalivibrio nitratireducens]AGA32064.1 Iron-sulfur cluster regulator IscR [Thioalkalivibrio nitratireducens DSM 14787]